MNSWLLLPILTPIVLGALLPLLVSKEDTKHLRIYLIFSVLLSAALTLITISLGDFSFRAIRVNDFINVFFHIDNLAIFFATVATLIWTLVMFYAMGHSIADKHNARFFSSLLVTYGAIIGACFSGNFFTFYLFYELVTLSNYPLITHKGTPEAKKAGMKYIIYSFLGAGMIFISFVMIAYFGQTTDFTAGGVFSPDALTSYSSMLLWVFLIGFVGFGVKAYIWPLFDWVPTVYPVTPAPAAALLSGVGSKVAIIAIIRLVFFIFGYDFLNGAWVQSLLVGATLLTIFLGSMLAFREKLLTRRLAYSSVSQLSYILFGIVLLNPIALMGALLHVLFHAVIKVTLFLSAGAIEQKTGKQYVYEMRGVGKAMPITLWCFTLAAVSLVGVPPTSGFISKVRLMMGAMNSSFSTLGIVGAGILLISALLAAGYLIPIFASAFFPGAKFKYEEITPSEPSRFVTVPLILFAVLSFAFGLFPAPLIDFLNSIPALLF